MDISRIGPEPGRWVAQPGPPGRPRPDPTGETVRSPGYWPDGLDADVSVSPQARLIIALYQAVQNASEVRPDVVADLKARIETGRYAVDEVELARRLVGRGRL